MQSLCWKVACALAGLLGGTAAYADCQLGQLAEIPITMRGMSPEMSAQINGRDARFTVDSGAFYSLISPGTAKENGLRLSGDKQGQIVGIGGMVDAGVTTVKTFTMAGVDLHDIQFIVGGSEVGGAGLIGQNVLHIADVEYDLPHGKISLFKPLGCSPKILAYWVGSQPYSELRLEESANRLAHTIATIRVNGKSVRAMFDTGAGGSVLSLSAARRLGINVDGEGAVRGGFGRGIGSHMVRNWIVTVPLIEIGGETLRNSRFEILDMDIDVDMLIGVDFFLAHRIYVANSQRKMWFTYSGGDFFNVGRTRTRAVDGEGKALDLKDDALPADAAGFSQHGMARLAKGDAAGSLMDLDKAVALAPAEPLYLLQRASVQRRMRHPALALADLDKALSLKPDFVDALIARAELFHNQEERTRAEQDADAASKLVDAAADARFILASIYEVLGRMEKSVGEYDRWIAAHPADSRKPMALNGRCRARALLGGELDKALADCSAAVRTMPQKEVALDTRGLVRLRRGELAEAIKDYDAALALNPRVAWSFYGRGLAKLKLGQKAEGDKDIAAALAINPRIADMAARWGIVP